MNDYNSLKKQKDFTDVYRSGIRRRNEYFILFRRDNNLSYHRYGVSVSKKVGNSVRRHRMIRMSREAFRKLDIQTDHFQDFVISWRKDDPSLKSDDVLCMIKRLYEKSCR